MTKMIRAVIFGGTTEGRRLCEACAAHSIPVIYCAATADGARPAEALPGVEVHTGRLNAAGIEALLKKSSPELAVDATHPYAREARVNIAKASKGALVPLIRVAREIVEADGCIRFDNIDDLLAWLKDEPGNVFVTTGSSHAAAFARLPDYQNRVWLRILPSMESLSACLALGYRPERLICMQGPFSAELNRAMLRDADARILVTKNSGSFGGFPEKLEAARSLGIVTAVLSKPGEELNGVSLSEAFKRIMELIQ